MWQSFLNPFFWEKEAKSLSWRYCIRKSELLTKVKVNTPVTAEEKVLVEAENSMKEPDKEAVKESAAEEAAAPEEPEAQPQPQPQPQQTQAAANGGKKPADPDDLMAIFEILDRK